MSRFCLSIIYFWRNASSGLRDRLLTNPRFQSRASRFFLTRRIARKRAQSLFDLCAGFVYSQVLLACVQLRLFEILANKPLSVPALAQQLALTDERTARLLNAAVALQLLEKRDAQRYGLGPLGAVVAGNPGLLAMIGHHAMLYDDLRDPLALLRNELPVTRLSGYWPYASAKQAANLDSQQVNAYSDLMAMSQPMISDEILANYPLHRHRCLLDVGGGHGAFLAAVAAHAPHLQLKLFDLPAVVDQARERFAGSPGVNSMQFIGGNFFVDPIPDGADIITLIRIIHDHDDNDVLALLRGIRRALPAGGKLLLAEPMSGHQDSQKMTDAYFGFYLMAMGTGRARTPGEIDALLREAGFSRSRLLANQMPFQTQIIIAE